MWITQLWWLDNDVVELWPTKLNVQVRIPVELVKKLAVEAIQITTAVQA